MFSSAAVALLTMQNIVIRKILIALCHLLNELLCLFPRKLSNYATQLSFTFIASVLFQNADIDVMCEMKNWAAALCVNFLAVTLAYLKKKLFQ